MRKNNFEAHCGMQQMTENEIVKIFACVSHGYCDTCTHKPRFDGGWCVDGDVAPSVWGFVSPSGNSRAQPQPQPIRLALNGCKMGCNISRRDLVKMLYTPCCLCCLRSKFVKLNSQHGTRNGTDRNGSEARTGIREGGQSSEGERLNHTSIKPTSLNFS